MNAQLQQTALWMAGQHRLVRWNPVDKLNTFERVDNIDYLCKAVRALGFALKVEVKFSTPTSTEERDSINPREVFQALTVLQAQVFAAYMSTGLGAAHSAGLFELYNRYLPQGAGAERRDPDWDAALKKVFDNLPQNET